MIFGRGVKTLKSINIRRAIPEDSADVWLWRNDAQTRLMSSSQEAIDWQSHSLWFERTLVSSDVAVYIGLDTELQKIGVCRFQRLANASRATVSLNLNPKFRGKYMSAKFLTAAVEAFLERNNCELLAVIRKVNTASIRCFENCGFVHIGEDGEFGNFLFRRS
jgi:L-amino acid N-acyltransferase YncA